MTRLVFVVLVACSTGSAQDAGVALPAPATSPTDAEYLPQNATHGAAIELVAITDDGGAAITQDASGGTRLWPALDGTREPIVVQLATAATLSIGRGGDGFVIAVLDGGGGAEVMRVTDRGIVMSRVHLPPEPPIESVVVAAQGVIVARSDQTLTVGETRLEAPAGTRIRQIVARGPHTLVLLSRDGTTSGRWLDGSRWGATTPTMQLDPRSTAHLSPNGKRLLIDYETATYVIEVASGKIVDNIGPAAPLGFVDDDTFTTHAAGKVVWRDVGAGYFDKREETELSLPPFAVADHLVVGAQRESLVLHAPAGVMRLGYQLGVVSAMRVIGDRVTVLGGGKAIVLDGTSLAERGPLGLPDDGRSVWDVSPIDENFAVATHTIGNGSGTWWTASVIDLEARTVQQVMQHALYTADLRYDPTTQLLAVTDNAASYLTAWDAKLHKFETWYRLAGRPATVFLVDPLRTDGIVAIGLRPDGDDFDIEAFHRDDLRVGEPVEPRLRERGRGRFATVDRTGTVYAIAGGALVVSQRGLEVMRIAEVGDVHVAPHPRGTTLALVGDNRIRLYDAAGQLLWQIAAPLARQIAWLGDDLVANYTGGIAKIDAASGALIQRSCGWTFGLSALSTDEPPAALPGDSICDAP